MTLTSCGLMNNLFRRKTGCPSNGRNIGAEMMFSDDKKVQKLLKRAKKFRS
jgi:hypothetical protein